MTDFDLGHFNLGIELGGLGRHADAVGAWRSAARLDPEGEQGRAALDAIEGLGARETP